MDYRMAAAAVDWMAEHMRRLQRETLEVHFFGGEPFAAPDVVEVAVHHARAVADRYGLVPCFEVATNGVFDEDQTCFIGDYFDTVVLSFDGPRQIHDRQRPMQGSRSSFKAVDRTARQLSGAPAELCLRNCVTRAGVDHMEDTSHLFCETYQPAIIAFETLQPTAESEKAGLRPPDPYVFAAQCLRAGRIIESYGVKAVYASATTEFLRHSFCPVGNDALIVSPDGRVSGCYLPRREWQSRGLDLDVGRLTGSGEMTLDLEAINRLRNLVVDKPRCNRCFCRWTCAGGCHVNHSYAGSPLKYNDFCIQTRILTAATLLNELDLNDLANELVDDQAAMQKLAMHPTDCLNGWEDG
jgi:uncharacterized protein